MHVMDTSATYRAGLFCDDRSMQSVINAFEIVSLPPFWPPTVVQGDQVFNTVEFKEFLANRSFQYQFSPPRRHSKNVLESNQGVIRSIYNRLCTHTSTMVPSLAAKQALRISNDIYGCSTLSDFELARGQSRSLPESPTKLPEDLLEAHTTISTKRKLPHFMHSRGPLDST